MSQNRKIKRRAEQKARKKAKKQTKKAINQLASMPNKCSACSAPFDVKNDFHLDNWTITVTDAGIRMLCNTCQESG